MKFREHKGSLTDSLETVVDVADKPDLVRHVGKLLSPFGVKVTKGTLKVQPYTYDARLGWDTHIVTVINYGVVGFTSGMVR